MKVGINADHVAQLSGMGTYVRGVIRGLGAVDSDGDYTLFANTMSSDTPVAGAERMRRVKVPVRNTIVRNGITLPWLVARERIDVLHVQYMALPLYSARIVVTVHDLIHERHPEFYPPSLVAQYRVLVPLTVRRAAVVLTNSEYSRQDIVRRYCVPPEKVVVAPCAPDPAFHPLRDENRVAEVRARYGTGEHFILYVGRIERRKNLKTLIGAYVRLRQADATRAKLVLVGPNEYYYDDIFAAARDSGYAADLVFTGHIPQEDLVAIFNAASVFVYPSLFEGQGVPPLEAMACGTPVVASNAASIPEVVGDAALTVDPLDAEAFAAAISTVLTDGELRTRLTAKGLQRAARFSWEDTARIIVRVYQEAAGTA